MSRGRATDSQNVGVAGANASGVRLSEIFVNVFESSTCGEQCVVQDFWGNLEIKGDKQRFFEF